MKILKYSILIIIVAVIVRCTPDDNGSFGDNVNRTEQIIGTWKLQSAFQVDLDAEKKGFPDFASKVDITNIISGMPFSDFELTINQDAITTVNGNSPMSVVISEGTGTWSWITNDEVELVNQELGINAVSGLKTTINNQEVNLYVQSFATLSSANPTLSLSYRRFDNLDNEVVRYEYVLTKQ